MRTAAALTALTVLLAPVPDALVAQTVEGRWDAEARSWNGVEKVQLQLRVRSEFRSNFGFTVDAAEVPELHLDDAGSETVRFTLNREAGTIVFEGRRDGDDAWGDFTWTGSDAYRTEMRRLGYGDLSTRDQFHMTVLDVTTGFVTAVHQQGHDNATLRELMQLRIHGASGEFMQSIADAGYDPGIRDLVQFRIHGVSAAFIAELVDAGLEGLSARDLQQARIHGVSAEFVSRIADAGLGNLSFHDLVQFRIHGVSGRFMADLADLGYDDLTSRDLLQFRIHGVSPSFIRELAERGYHDVPPRMLIQFRIHGVSGAFVDELRDRGFTDLTPEDLVQAKIHSGWWRRR